MLPHVITRSNSNSNSHPHLQISVGQIRRQIGAEADAGLRDSIVDELLEPGKRAAADEEDVGRVHLYEV